MKQSKKCSRAFLLIVLLACSAGCATTVTQPIYLASDFVQAKPQLRRIAVLPFANETRVPHAANQVRQIVIRALSGSSHPPGDLILPREFADSKLEGAGISSFKDAIGRPFAFYQELLGADAVLIGQVSRYDEPTSEGRLTHFWMGQGQASAWIKGNLQLFDCKTGHLLWNCDCTGDSVAIFAFQAFSTSTEAAVKAFEKNLEQSWPWSAKKP